MMFRNPVHPHTEVTVMKAKKSKNRDALRDFGIGMLLGGGVAAVLLLAVYLFVVLPFL